MPCIYVPGRKPRRERYFRDEAKYEVLKVHANYYLFFIFRHDKLQYFLKKKKEINFCMISPGLFQEMKFKDLSMKLVDFAFTAIFLSRISP